MSKSASKPTMTLDMTGMSCPAPLLGAKKVVDDLPAGQTMMLISDCPGTSDDLYAWARYTGNKVLSSERLDLDPRNAPHVQHLFYDSQGSIGNDGELQGRQFLHFLHPLDGGEKMPDFADIRQLLVQEPSL